MYKTRAAWAGLTLNILLPPLLSPGVSGLAATDLELEMGAHIDNWRNPGSRLLKIHLRNTRGNKR